LIGLDKLSVGIRTDKAPVVVQSGVSWLSDRRIGCRA
jgi:hypothetical protein